MILLGECIKNVFFFFSFLSFWGVCVGGGGVCICVVRLCVCVRGGGIRRHAKSQKERERDSRDMNRE